MFRQKGRIFRLFCPTRLSLDHISGMEYVPCVFVVEQITLHILTLIQFVNGSGFELRYQERRWRSLG